MRLLKPSKNRINSRFLVNLAGILLGIALLSLAGCGGGLPDDIKTKAKSLTKGMDSTQTFIEDQQAKFTNLKSSPDFAPMARYADKENWAASFDQAKDTLSRAQGLYDKELAPILKQNKPDGAVQALVQINRINKVVQEAKKQAQIPFNRMDRIRTAMKEAPAMATAALASGKTILSGIQTIGTGPLIKAKEKFPDSAKLIDTRFAPFSKMETDTQKNMAVVETQSKAHKSGTADYAAFVTAVDAIARDKTRFKTDGPKLEKDLDQLYQSYTKVLQDMKEDYFVTIKRESWDERSDYYNPRFTSFTRQVSPATYQTLMESEADSIAELSPGYGGMNIRVTKGLGGAWQMLDLKPTENWPDRRHNAASLWVESGRAAYFHKYLKEENGETTETDWVKVNPSFYEQNYDNLGMAILSKPYGAFEPDAMAAPPGMAYVGNPQYGEWKEDENGESFWSWYGRYAFFSHLFFFPPSYYYYGSWNRWRTDYRYKKPYYGKTKTGAYTYGTRGTKIKRSPRYQNTTFAKTGGFKSRPASVRGGSSSLRGGGPKGKGK
ncbi:MAG: hypothetical protein MI892_29695 [Desulfobacterales bacterium]|nr:hypothetical protein [Desulfobacterales bacterium]